nr:MAG TPA: hypothetical protein [Caudoviricetes sp.]
MGSSPAGGTFGNRQKWRFSFIFQRFSSFPISL